MYFVALVTVFQKAFHIYCSHLLFTYTSSELFLAATEQTQQHFDVQAQKMKPARVARLSCFNHILCQNCTQRMYVKGYYVGVKHHGAKHVSPFLFPLSCKYLDPPVKKIEQKYSQFKVL